MDLMLKNKAAIVTGSGEGIGRRTVLLLAEEGANVIVNDISLSKAENVASEARSFGVEALAVYADVTSWEGVSQMVKQAIDKFGKIDILVNNAGRGADWEGGESPKSFVQTEKKDWDYTIGVCLYGTLNCSRALLPHMIDRKYGKIVNISSDAGRVGEPNLTPYAAAKGGIIAFTKSLAKEVGPYNICVNSVSLGATQTERNIRTLAEWKEQLTEEAFEKKTKRMLSAYPLGRLGETIDIARAIVFFCSDCTSWVTGQVLSVNGGFSMVS